MRNRYSSVRGGASSPCLIAGDSALALVEKTELDYTRQLALHEQEHNKQVEGIVAALCP
jgi:hypothetical protein